MIFKKYALIMVKPVVIFAILFIAAGSCNVHRKSFAEKQQASKGQIMFTSNRDGNFDVYLMDDDSTNVTNLTANKATDYGINWSPEGKFILFYSDRTGNDDVWRLNTGDGSLVNLTNAPSAERSAAYSPDGKTILFISNRDNKTEELYLMNADGSNVRRITNNKMYCESPGWTNDGKSIFFTLMVNEDSTGKSQNGELFMMNIDGTNQKRLTNRKGFDSGADISPDGKRIAFYGRSENGTTDIFIMNINGSEIVNLTNDALEDYSPSWSPDGNWLAFTSGNSKNYDIWKMNIKTKEKMRLTTQIKRDETPYYKPVQK